jgi:secretion/DNA translocation related CpaE-like protein
MTSVLVATRDPVLLDELSRLVAAAGCRLVTGADEPLRAWSSSTLVLVGADLAPELAGLDPARRPHVYVVASGPAVESAFRVALALGADRVVELPAEAAWLSGVMADLGEEREQPGRLVGVIGGSGGAGATTFACALGQVAARDGPAVVVDTDPLGPGADRVLGLDGAPGVRWDDLGLTSGRLGARSFRDALPRCDGLAVLTWSAGSTVELSAATVRESLSAAARGHDVVVVDLPRGTDRLVEETVLRCDLVVLVVRATVASVAATARVVGRLPEHSRIGLVTRGSGIDPDDLAALTGAPLLAAMSDQRGLAESVDLGLGPVRRRRGPLARAARRVLTEVAR